MFFMDNKINDLGSNQRRNMQGTAAPEGGWWCSSACRQVDEAVARAAAQGLSEVAVSASGVPLSWQLIRGCAVSAPEV